MVTKNNPEEEQNGESPQSSDKSRGRRLRHGDGDRDILLSKEDAAAASPADESVGGEEDPGVGLEFLVRKNKR